MIFEWVFCPSNDPFTRHHSTAFTSFISKDIGSIQQVLNMNHCTSLVSKFCLIPFLFPFPSSYYLLFSFCSFPVQFPGWNFVLTPLFLPMKQNLLFYG